MTFRAALIAAVFTASLGLPASAAAQSCQAPPGSAAVDQYCEAVPDDDGTTSGTDFQREAASPGSSRASGRPSALPAVTQRELRRQGGGDGAAQGVTALVRQSAPPASSSADVRPDAADAAVTEVDTSVPDNPLRAITAAVENGPTAGSGLVWALLMVALAVVAAAWLGARRT